MPTSNNNSSPMTLSAQITGTVAPLSQIEALIEACEITDPNATVILRKNYPSAGMCTMSCTVSGQTQTISWELGEVISVNGKSGTVVLNAADVGAANTSHSHNVSEITNLVSLLNSKLSAPADSGTAGMVLTRQGDTYIWKNINFPVTSVNGKTGAVTLTANDVSAAAANHTHAISDVSTLSDALLGKQDTIADINTIRTNAALGATALQAEADPIFSASPAGSILNTDIANWNSKAAGSHTHSEDDITNLTAHLSAKANALHDHRIYQIENLQNSLDAKQNVISDLTTIRTNANLATTALQPAALQSYRTAASQDIIDNTKYTYPNGGIPLTDLDSLARETINKKIKEPNVEGTNGQVLTTDGTGGRRWSSIPSALVSSVNGRAGAVVLDADAVGAVEEPATEGISGQVLTTDGNGGRTWTDPLNAFKAIYNVTTYAEILAAKQAGKPIFAVYNSGIFNLNKFNFADSYFCFSADDAADARGTIILKCSSENGWEFISGPTKETTSSKKNSMLTSGNINSTYYPTTKAVSDFVNDKLDAKISEPTNEGTNGQVLTTNGSGTRTWTTIPSCLVSSVNGKTGTVVLDADDVGAVEEPTTAGTTGQVLALGSNGTEWIDKDDIFFATFNVTPFADILAAKNAGKKILGAFNGKTLLFETLQNNTAYFVYWNTISNQLSRMSCTASGWTIGNTVSLEYLSNKKTDVEANKTSDTYYPTTKAVDTYVTTKLATKISEPTTEGTSGQVLTTDGNGGRTWIDKSDIFIAKYNETTWIELKEAYDAGKTIVCSIGGYLGTCNTITATYAYFCMLPSDGQSIIRLECNSTTGWSSTTVANLQSTAYKTSDIVSKSTDTNYYPNTKGVYDFVKSENKFYVLVEGTDYTISTTDTAGVAPYSTAYKYTNFTITKPGVQWIRGAKYNFYGTTAVNSSYRNLRARIGENGTYVPFVNSAGNGILAASSYFNTTWYQNNYFYTYETGLTIGGASTDGLKQPYDANSTYNFTYAINLTGAKVDNDGKICQNSFIFATSPANRNNTFSSILQTNTYSATNKQKVEVSKLYVDMIPPLYWTTASLNAGDTVTSTSINISSRDTIDVRYGWNYTTDNMGIKQQAYFYLKNFDPSDFSFEPYDEIGGPITRDRLLNTSENPTIVPAGVSYWYFFGWTGTSYKYSISNNSAALPYCKVYRLDYDTVANTKTLTRLDIYLENEDRNNINSKLDKTGLDSYIIDKSLFTNPTTTTSNASTIINNAITAAAAAGKQYVLIPEGTYWLTSTIYIQDGIILKGHSMDTTILKIANGYDIDAIRSPNHPINNCGIMDLAIDGNRITNYSTFSTGHHGNAINVWMHYGIIERVRTNWVYKHSLLLNYDVGTGDDGLGFDSQYENSQGNLNKVLWCDFRDSLLQGVMWGWRTMDSWMCYTNIGSHAANLYLEGGTSRFIGNHFDGDGDNGSGPEYNVICQNGCNTMVFTDNIFENTQKQNIYFPQPGYDNVTRNVTIANNIIRTCSKSANNTYPNIYISGYSTSSKATDIIITGNQILNPDLQANHGTCGIQLVRCNDVKIEGNTYYNVGDNNYIIDSSCTNVTNDDELVKDVQINNTSIVSNGVATIPLANSSVSYGVVKAGNGIAIGSTGIIYTAAANNSILDNRTVGQDPTQAADNTRRVISPANIDYAVKVSMCDGKGSAWTSSEKTAAQTRIGIITLTQAEYDAIADPDPSTIYIIKEGSGLT